MAEYLGIKSELGVHHDVLRDIGTSLSMACAEASDKRYQPGASFTVTSFFEGERRCRPVRRNNNGVYYDLAKLYQEIWLYGPDSAMALGHKKERIILLLFADTACRPSDIWRLYRLLDGWRQQIAFFDGGVKIRFFYPKEVLPGSSRDNSTGYYFSSWVVVHETTPVEISTPQCLKNFLEESSGPIFATKHVTELDCEAQPLAWAAFQKGKFQPCSKDTLRKIVKSGLQAAGMGKMTARSVRGASPSKIVQLFPDLLPEALKLGRWTDRKTFNNHYQSPVELMHISNNKSPTQLGAYKNLQQVLRWGFTPRPPPHVSAGDYMKGPEFWLGKSFARLGKVHSFDSGIYVVKRGGKSTDLFHYELMMAISSARS